MLSLAAGVSCLAVPRAGTIQIKQRNEMMNITRSGSQPSGKGPSEYFSGAVRIRYTLSNDRTGSRRRCNRDFRTGRKNGVAHTSTRPNIDYHVRHRPGAARWRANRGGSARRSRVVSAAFAPTSTAAMTHVAIAEALDGKSVDWLEHISDAVGAVGIEPTTSLCERKRPKSLQD
jgi:hypothetical protein